MTVASILKDKGGAVVSVKPQDPIAGVARLLAGHGIGAVLVLDPAGALLGILSERDIVRGLASAAPRCWISPPKAS